MSVGDAYRALWDACDPRRFCQMLVSVCPVSSQTEPVPFRIHQLGMYLHGTKADVSVGETLGAGRDSNFEEGRVIYYDYFTSTFDDAAWGTELAAGKGRGRIYIVELTGHFDDDPNVTEMKFPGNPTQSFRSIEPLLTAGELLA